ncbi:MAG: hypothetical protein DDT19_02788 [Syntrophomonadaceae bacterium]|nr:hypothetical protein [Bacillota bacterium]
MKVSQENITYWRKRAQDKKRRLSLRKQEGCKAAQQCAGILATHYGARKVYLIGSLTGSRSVHERSDIDLVVEGLRPEEYFSALSALWRVLPKGMELDLIPWEDAYPQTKQRAYREGEVLYERPLPHS